MPPRRRKRPDPSSFGLPVEQIRNGVFSDDSILALRAAVDGKGRSPRVLMQVAGTNTGYVGGVDEAVAILKLGVEDWSALTVHALFEGDRFERWDTVLTIDGPLLAFAHVEALCLGVLSRRTRVCTNARYAIEAAASKPVILLGERDDHFLMQPGDGYAAQAGGVSLISSEAQGSLFAGRRVYSVSYSLIAACGGDTVKAAELCAANVGDKDDLLVPVDFENDCVRTSLQLAQALGDRLWGVRVNTPDTMVDRSVVAQMGTFRPNGVSPQLAWNVRNALDAEGFGEIKIVASGGFDAARIRSFEDEGAAVDAYAIGGELHDGRYEFTSDIVKVDGKRQGRVGRDERTNPKLAKVT